MCVNYISVKLGGGGGWSKDLSQQYYTAYLKSNQSVNLNILITHKKGKYVRWWICLLTNLNAVLISQYIHTSNHYVVHFKHTRCYLSIYLSKVGGNPTLNVFFFPFLHCPSGCYAVVVIQVECGCLNDNAHSIYQFILKC